MVLNGDLEFHILLERVRDIDVVSIAAVKLRFLQGPGLHTEPRVDLGLEIKTDGPGYAVSIFQVLENQFPLRGE